MADWRTFSSARGVLVGTDSSVLPTNMFNMDPPRHDQLRSVLSRVLTPSPRRGSRAVRPRAGSGPDRAVPRERAGRRDHGVRAGHPVDRRRRAHGPRTPPTARSSSSGTSRRSGSQDFVGPEALQAYVEMDAYWRETIAARRGQRTDDVVSEIFHAQVGGENLTDDEIYGFCSLILPASQHTTINMMSNTAITLARYPEQRAMLRRDPGLWADAMEELIRYESPVQGLGRTAMRDVELHGVTIPEGAWVLMLFGSANHDERVFENPDVLDITRQGARPHYSFGHGIHYCLGNAVATAADPSCARRACQRARRVGCRRRQVSCAINSFPVGASRTPRSLSILQECDGTARRQGGHRDRCRLGYRPRHRATTRARGRERDRRRHQRGVGAGDGRSHHRGGWPGARPVGRRRAGGRGRGHVPGRGRRVRRAAPAALERGRRRHHPA